MNLKLLLVMKLIVLLITTCCLHLSAATYGQRITISKKQITLPQLFEQIKAQTGYHFFWKGAQLEQIKVDIHAKDASLTDVMDKALEQQAYNYTIVNKTIIIREKEKKSMQVAQQQEPVAGKVTDSLGNPLPGVSVLVIGQAGNGVATDASGNFSLPISTTVTLRFALLGFATVEKTVEPGSKLSIVLSEEAGLLDEIIVVGYGVQKKVNLTGAIASVSSDDIASRPAATATNAIQGMMPGVTVSSTSGKPGSSNAAIRIRGIGSLNNPNPLVLIDGFEGSLDNINADDIASISVLKDAASSSIYGSRAANGVVLVTTKSAGKNKPMQLSYGGYLGSQSPTKLPKYLDAATYMQLRGEAERNVGQPITYSDEDIQKVINGTDPNFYANTNWIDAVYKNEALQQNHNLSLQGGGDQTSYYLSYGYLDQAGNVVGNAFGSDRHNLRMKLNTTLWDKLHIGGNVGYVDKTTSEPAIPITGNTGLLYIALRNSPLVPVRFTNGDWGYGGGASNAVAMATDGGDYRLNNQQLTGNFSADMELLPGLQVKAQYGTVIENWRGNRFTKKIVYNNPETGAFWYQDSPLNLLEVEDNTSRYQSIIAQADYNKQWGKHQFHVLAGFSQEWQVSDGYLASRQGVISNEVPSLNLGTANQQNAATAYQWAIRSGFSRLNYSFNDKYLLEINMRYDGSSRFPKDNRFGLFPSFSGGWRASQESFIRQWLPAGINELKIRGSWGKLGNQYLDADSYTNAALYPYLSLYEAITSQPFGGVINQAFAIQTLSNPNITWESSTMTDIGLDMELFDGKLGLTADYFVKNTNDILLRVPLPDVIGLNEPSINAGAVQNKGWEVQLNWQQKFTDFRYSLGLNVSDVRNKVTDLGGVPPTYDDQIRMLNQPIDAFYGLVADGLAQESDFSYDASTNTYTPLFPVIAGDAAYLAPGDVKYKDLNGDGEITLNDDRQVIGNPLPRYTYGFRGNFGYKQFDLSFFLQGVGKADGYIKGVGRHAFTQSVAYPQEVHLDRWTPENTDASYPRFTYQQSFNARFSSFWLENASYMRLKNVQVGYTFPERITSKLKMSRLRCYVSADNLLTLTDFFDSYDPESPVSDGGFYPQIKTIVFGVNLTFN